MIEVHDPHLQRRFDELTPREKEILRRIARGMSNAAISRDIYLSEATIKTHVTRILRKLAVTSRVQAVVLAYETGFVRRGHASSDSDAA